MQDALLNWYRSKHPNYVGTNSASESSLTELRRLDREILIPITNQFSQPAISYGFTSHALLLWILKNRPGDMAPSLDQHASMENNSKGNRICKRDGAACDFYIEDQMGQMDKVAQYIIEHLPFDRLYYYGRNKPIHVSVGAENARYVQCRTTKHDGTRVAGRYAYGKRALKLFS